MSNDPRDSDTVRDLPKSGRIHDTVPEQANVYVAPRPLAPTSDHRTIQVKPVLISAFADPRRAPTELRLAAPPRLAPPPRRMRWLIPLALLAVAFGALLAVRFTGEPGAAPVPAANAPAPEPVPRSPHEPTAAAPAAAGPAAPVAARTAAEAVATAQSSATAAPSAPTRKKQRDPWLE